MSNRVNQWSISLRNRHLFSQARNTRHQGWSASPVYRVWQNTTRSCAYRAIFSCVHCMQYNEKSGTHTYMVDIFLLASQLPHAMLWFWHVQWTTYVCTCHTLQTGETWARSARQVYCSTSSNRLSGDWKALIGSFIPRDTVRNKQTLQFKQLNRLFMFFPHIKHRKKYNKILLWLLVYHIGQNFFNSAE